jgi:hypothetical protein
MRGSLTCLIWLTLGAFAIGTEGFMIAGLLPALLGSGRGGRTREASPSSVKLPLV